VTKKLMLSDWAATGGLETRTRVARIESALFIGLLLLGIGGRVRRLGRVYAAMSGGAAGPARRGR
jgi:hypothetical protein